MCSLVGLMAVGTVMQAGSSIMQGRMAAQQGDLQAAAGRREAKLTEQKGAFDAARATERARGLIGTQIATASANGLQIDGSVADVIDDSAQQSQLDIDAIRYGANTQAANARFDARVARFNGQAGKTAGYINAGSDLISGATRIAGTF